MMPVSTYDSLSPAEAIAYQKELRKLIRIEPLHTPVRTIGGADISFNKYEEKVYAGIIVLSFPELTEIERVTIIGQSKFPYISGLLAFREIPALMQAWEKLAVKPDLMVLDGQGIAHERRTGIATHFGLLTGVPSIGCAKSRLIGKYHEPDAVPFAESILEDRGDQVGVALRTRRNCKPVFISPGHLISIQQSVDIIKRCTGRHRIPEPTRRAHLLVNAARVQDHPDSLYGQQSLF